MLNPTTEKWILMAVAVFVLVGIAQAWAGIGIGGPILLGISLTIIINWARKIGQNEKELEYMSKNKKRK